MMMQRVARREARAARRMMVRREARAVRREMARAREMARGLPAKGCSRRKEARRTGICDQLPSTSAHLNPNLCFSSSNRKRSLPLQAAAGAATASARPCGSTPSATL